ncbi:MAG: fumarylacetoacetate hydrolase family protein [Actinomycetota bacterium]|nr:fumarylacetoacetate hydrolase family protein [Actinomycetota bacterium]
MTGTVGRRPPEDRLCQELTARGRPLYGDTPPGGAVPCGRTTPLEPGEVDEVVATIARGRRERHGELLPERLRTRDWSSVVRVLVGLLDHVEGTPAGWKVGAASEEVRRAEGLPEPSPGRIYRETVFESGATLPEGMFVNYRNCECEYAFQLGLDFPSRDEPYSRADVEAGIELLFPALELGDSVFPDWYGASAYFGSCLDNGGGAALVSGERVADWRSVDLDRAGVDLYLEGCYVKSGSARAAMGHPVTSLTWLVNWVRSHGIGVAAGEVVSTGTCTGHLFAARGDEVAADFGELGTVTVRFA